METFVVKNLEDFEAAAAWFVTDIGPTYRGATLITLSGELGAGKTAFTKAAAKALGVSEVVHSPTFVLEKIYMIPKRGHDVSTGRHVVSAFSRLVHIDAYRLEGGSELAPLGFDEIMQESKNLVMLEWPEKVQDALVQYPSIAITIEVLADNARKITKIRHD